MNYKLLMPFLCLALCGLAISAAAQHRLQPLNKIETVTHRCPPNPDPLYNRSQVLNELADILNRSIPEYSEANPKGFYTDNENGIDFFVVDLTNPSNKNVLLGDCVDFIKGHVYHVAPPQAPYSLSHIVILEEGRLKVFRSINCPDRGDRLEDAIKYVSALLANDKKRNQIINRIRHYKRYGYYYSMDHASFICNQRK
jgi:hypothetical protein